MVGGTGRHLTITSPGPFSVSPRWHSSILCVTDKVIEKGSQSGSGTNLTWPAPRSSSTVAKMSQVLARNADV